MRRDEIRDSGLMRFITDEREVSKGDYPVLFRTEGGCFRTRSSYRNGIYKLS